MGMNQLRRFVAFILDLSIGHFLFFLLLSFSPVEALLDEVMEFMRSSRDIVDIIGIDEDYLATLISIYIFSYFIKFYSTLLFGRTAGQAVMILKSSGNFIWSRIAGSIRELAGLFLTPFVIFDLPLIKGQSLTEKITFCPIEALPMGKKALLAPLGSVVILIISFFAPLFYHMSLIDGLKVSFAKVKKVKLHNQSQFENFQNYRSHRYMFETFTDLSGGRFVMIPEYEIIREKDATNISAYLKIYDKDLKKSYNLLQGEAYSLLKVLAKAQMGNFLFKTKYPSLAEAIENEPLYKRWPAVEGKKLKKLFRPEIVVEIQSLIESALELGYGNLSSHILNEGPFIRGHVELRKTLLDIVEEGVAPEVDVVKMGNNSFLRFQHHFKALDTLKGDYQETFFPIDSPYAQVMVLTCESCEGDESGLEIFKNLFFGGSQWTFDYQQDRVFPKNAEQVNALSIVDYLNVTSMPDNLKNGFEEGIYNLYFELGKKALITGDENLQKLLTESLAKLSIVVGTINNVKKDYYSQKLEKFLQVLKFSLSKKDKRFFALDETVELKRSVGN